MLFSDILRAAFDMSAFSKMLKKANLGHLFPVHFFTNLSYFFFNFKFFFFLKERQTFSSYE